jgi:type II secretory pathway predicted ATPase ExeA
MSESPSTTLREVLAERGVSIRRLAEIIGVAERSARRWVNGDAAPTGAARVQLAACLAPIRLDDVVVSSPPPVASPAAAPMPTEGERPMEITPREFLDPEDLDHFGLSADPFDLLLDPEDIYLSPRLQNIERTLHQTVTRRGMVALTGDPGSGKSTILRRLHARYLRDQRIRIIAPASLNRKKVTHAVLAVSILRDLIGRDTTSMSMEARDELLRTTLAEQVSAGRYPVLFIDEAHLLSNDALIALKHLWDSHTLLQQLAILLIGQSPLAARLREDPSIREVVGRMRLVALGKIGDDTAGYLRWRFEKVGGDADKVFTPDAYRALALRGEGPLWVANKAVVAMRYAREHGDDQVTVTHVGRA